MPAAVLVTSIIAGAAAAAGFAAAKLCPRKGKVHDDMTSCVGNTPMVRLNKVMRGLPAKVVAKLEMYEPGFSVKDRIALSMFNAAEKDGLITPGRTNLVEITSGNTGIALAWIAAVRGYSLTLVMPAYYSIERRVLMQALGAKVIITDPEGGVPAAIAKLQEVMKATPDAFLFAQFANPANVAAHFDGTGPEIWAQTGGRVDVLVLGSGTGGTISGVGRYIKRKNPKVHIVVVEPEDCAYLSGGKLGHHDIQGIGPGFAPDNLDQSIYDEVITVTTKDAFDMAKRLAREEGILAGISSGAAAAVAARVAARPEFAGKTVVTLLASAAERYMSTGMYQEYRDFAQAMTWDKFVPPPPPEQAEGAKVEAAADAGVA